MSYVATIIGKPGFSDRDAEETAKSFKKAMKGIGTDEKRIIKEIVGHTNAQRQVIKEKYQAMYGKSLEEDLKSELRGNFEDVVIALLTPRYRFEAQCMRDAIKGIGTQESLVIELLCSKEGHEIEELKRAYNEEYGRDLEKDIKSEEDGPLGRIFRSLASGDRPSGNAVDQGLAHTEAKQLYDAGEGKFFGTDEVEFVRILCSRSFAQLRATFEEYYKISKKDIEHSIKKETSGDLESALVTLVQCIRNRPLFFANQLRNAMKGVGTKDKNLIRIIVTRSEIDLASIRQEYKRTFNHSLFDELKKELSGDYEDIILALVGKD